ncbi:MAG: helix-turn-helix domain-containing protein [Thermoguttaceae bacterium]
MQVGRYRTPPTVAEEYGVDVHRVLGWIHNGELHAVNVGDGAQRPRYRISPADLAAFEASRSATPQPKITRCRRRRDQLVEEFF